MSLEGGLEDVDEFLRSLAFSASPVGNKLFQASHLFLQPQGDCAQLSVRASFWCPYIGYYQMSTRLPSRRT